MNYLLQEYQTLTKDIVRIILSPVADSLHYQAGQYLEILFPDNSYQPFSIANAPNPAGKIELHIRHLETDIPTKQFLQHLREHEQITVRGPLGKAHYIADDKPCILLAGGTGFAYCKAIIEQMQLKQAKHLIHLFWGVKVATDFYLPDLTSQWEKQFTLFRFTPVISQPQRSVGWNGKTGYVHEIVLADYNSLAGFRVYASGPAAMIHTALHLFMERGLERSDMVSDML